jgi:ribosome-binding protein aMBF1 (putative translation factor)
MPKKESTDLPAWLRTMLVHSEDRKSFERTVLREMRRLWNAAHELLLFRASFFPSFSAHISDTPSTTSDGAVMTTATQIPDGIRQAIEQALQLRQASPKGKELRFLAPCHDDQNPSARWNCDKLTVIMGPRTFAMNLKVLRTARGMTQVELAKKMKKKQAYIAQLEFGTENNPTLDTLRRLARALKTTVGALVG